MNKYYEFDELEEEDQDEIIKNAKLLLQGESVFVEKNGMEIEYWINNYNSYSLRPIFGKRIWR
jgi:hypothetical protein